jgi:hypothetical protein
LLFIIPRFSSALPSTNEVVYESLKLNTKVYRDALEKDIYWYVPPVKLVENPQTKKIYTVLKNNTQVDYLFYFMAYMSDELESFLAGELNLVSRSQLKPITIRQLSVKIQDFVAKRAFSDEVTDYQFLNIPHLVRVSLNKKDTRDFEFLLNNYPGVMATVDFAFDSNTQEKFLNIELRHKEVYEAMTRDFQGSIGQGKIFTKAQIAKKIEDYISEKYVNVRSKGDIPIPEIVLEAMKECFTPVYKKSSSSQGSQSGGSGYPGGQVPGCGYGTDDGNCNGCPDWDDECPNAKPPGSPSPYNFFDGSNSLVSQEESEEVEKHEALEEEILDIANSVIVNEFQSEINTNTNKFPYEVYFELKSEIANPDRILFYREIRFKDSKEVTSIPFYLSTTSKKINEKTQVKTLENKSFIITEKYTRTNPLKTGIFVGENEQHFIDSNFAIQALSNYGDGKIHWYRPNIVDESVTEALLYRIGNSPWIPLDKKDEIDKRAIIKAETLYKGEIQFALDKPLIWKKLNSKYKTSSFGGLLPPHFYYKNFFPQFQVMVSGRKFIF